MTADNRIDVFLGLTPCVCGILRRMLLRSRRGIGWRSREGAEHIPPYHHPTSLVCSHDLLEFSLRSSNSPDFYYCRLNHVGAYASKLYSGLISPPSQNLTSGYSTATTLTTQRYNAGYKRWTHAKFPSPSHLNACVLTHARTNTNS